MRRLILLAMLGLGLVVAAPAMAQKVLFDARHGETAGEADWIVDADTSQLTFLTFQCRTNSNRHHSGQRFPTPPQSQIQQGTPETFWEGGISAWAMALAKDALNPVRGRNWQIEQYAWDGPAMTFGNAGNPQDLSNYDVLILAEPNSPYSASEAQAIVKFVEEGGGLFLIADHETSDRDCSGGPNGEKGDSPFILNRLMGTQVQSDPTPPYFDPSDPDNDFGVFGIWFHENGNDDQNDDQNKNFDWFDEAVNDNVDTDPTDPIINGPFGNGHGGLGFFGSTQMSISTDPVKGNPTARAHVWRNGQGHTANDAGVSDRVTFATAQFGRGRVAAIGDSSPADDGSGQGSLHPGWDKATGGVANHIIFLNATEWLAGAEADTTAPRITGGPSTAVSDCHARVDWMTDEPALGTVDWGESVALAQHSAGAAPTRQHVVDLAPLDPSTEYFYQVSATDPAGNGPTRSTVLRFTTEAGRAPGITSGPAAGAVTDRSATITWSTDEAGTSVVRFGTDPSLGQEKRSDDGPASAHSVILTGLEPAKTYHLRVETTDACGKTVQSAAMTFTTAARPSTRDLAGWKLVNSHADFSYTFPAGSEIPANGYLVVGRESDRAAFEAEWGPLPAGTLYVNSGNEILVNGTARPYRLLDAQGNVVDGPTAEVKAGQSRHRTAGCQEGAAAWGQRQDNSGDPGRGAPASCGAGVILTELSDRGDFHHEFVEIFFDAGNGP
ncbi:MAG TPA: fibronectin type III domain-containing protein [Thermoanaerobaculia bacterium]|nr:fibronectin type III domain-containing protein [Thermoanaerobaculia bacterium]